MSKIDMAKSHEAMAYALRVRTDIIKTISETVWEVSRREYRQEVRVLIAERAAKTSPNTGHGKAQRAFANALLKLI